MFRSFAAGRLRSKIKKENKNRSRSFSNWDQIQKVALILSETEAINKSSLDQFIEQSKKFVEVYFIELSKKDGSFSDWSCFTKKEKNFLGLPHKHITHVIFGKKYDLVIDVVNGEEMFSAALASGFVAPLKCGNSNGFEQNDLIIVRKENQDLLSYLNDIIHYLKMIRN